MLEDGTAALGEVAGKEKRYRERLEDSAFFGHPRGLGFIVGLEAWERFSFYGMQALLMLYLTQHLLAPAVADGVVGLTALRRLVSPDGSLSDLAFASQVFGLYSGCVYLTPLLGAWLGDRVVGRTPVITLGCVLMSAGHLAMASERWFLAALALIILGAGLVKGNMSAQLGLLYGREDDRRTRAFGLYLIALNVGALLAPLIAGTLGEKVGWHWGFGAAAVGMMIGLVTYVAGRRHMPPDTLVRGEKPPPLSREEWRRVTVIAGLQIPGLLCYAAAFQSYGLMLVWGEKAVDLQVAGFRLPVTWLITADGVMTIAGVYLGAAVWKALAARGREPNDLNKAAIGFTMISLAFVYLGFVARLPIAPLILWLLFYAIADAAYAWIDPPQLALITRNAPRAVAATILAAGSLCTAGSYFLLGWLGQFFEVLGPSAYWMMTAVLPGLSALAYFLAAGRAGRVLDLGATAPGLGPSIPAAEVAA